MAGDRDQKTEQPTAKRKREARQKGQVARSPILVGWATLLAATVVVPPMMARIGEHLSAAIEGVQTVAADPTTATLGTVVGSVVRETLLAAAPLLLLCVVIGVVGTVAQVGFLLTVKPLVPKWERVSPAAGLKRLFSVRSIWETAKQVALVLVICLLAVPAVRSLTEVLAGSPWSLSASLSRAGASILSLVQIIAFVGTVAGLADFAWQRWSLARDSRMTKQEVRQEHRENEGDPHVKARLRSIRASMSRNRMLAAVGDADVVITNPTHVAVALQYLPSRGAPLVLATGADAVAARIRERAVEAGVPVVESPPLARALHRACQPEDEIPPQLFQAVATVLAFVHRVGARRLAGTAVTLPVSDSWTPPGADPETALARPRRRPPARRATNRRPNPQPAR